MTLADLYKLQARAELLSTHERLLEQARVVAERMMRLTHRLEAQGPASAVNELGELQSYATDLDRLCVVLVEKQRVVRTLERFLPGDLGEARS